MQAAFDGFHRQPKGRRHFWCCHTLNVTHNQDLPVLWWQVSNRVCDIVGQHALVRPLCLQVLHRKLIDRFLAAHPAEEPQALVLDHLENPRRKRAGNTKRPDLP